jgi:uncharacterized protein YkwD
MKPDDITRQFTNEHLSGFADYRIAYGSVPERRATPNRIVENWMNLVGKSKNILGDFNRVGYGFVTKDRGALTSLAIYVRSIPAAVIDGTETVMDGTILATQISEMLNEFRSQHSLPSLNIDPDLCLVAQDHSEYVANGHEGDNPIDGAFFTCECEPRYVATDISHMSCIEISRAPKAFMERWRNNVDCISVILNQVDDMGLGVCFDKNYVCHITVIVGSKGKPCEVSNIIYRL